MLSHVAREHLDAEAVPEHHVEDHAAEAVRDHPSPGRRGRLAVGRSHAAGPEEALGDVALEPCASQLELLGPEEAGRCGVGRLDHDRGDVVGHHARDAVHRLPSRAKWRRPRALLEEPGEALAAEQAALGVGFSSPSAEHRGDRARHQRHRRLAQPRPNAHADRRRRAGRDRLVRLRPDHEPRRVPGGRVGQGALSGSCTGSSTVAEVSAEVLSSITRPAT